jgi:hypothetical protein
MWPIRFLLCSALAVTSVLACRAQSAGVSRKSKTQEAERQPPNGHFILVQTISAPADLATGFDEPLICDRSGNLYLQSTQDTGGVRKLNARGERTTVFQPTGDPSLKIDFVGYFALGSDGELYQLTYPHELARYVFAYRSDGTFKSSIKLQPGFAWMPSTLAVFPSGNFFISALRYVRDEGRLAMAPFNGIFSSDGTLLKEVKLEDDDALRDLAASGETRVSSPTNPHANHAIEFGRAEAGTDGNIYLMRWVTPAIFYAISPGGEVVRRFTVDPEDEAYRPSAMHIADNRIAVLFF